MPARGFGEERNVARKLAAQVGVWTAYHGFYVKRYADCECVFASVSRAPNAYPRMVLHGACHPFYNTSYNKSGSHISLDRLLAQLVVLQTLSTDTKFMQRLALSRCLHIYPGDHGA